jgi:formylglycine-generating enzyme required for sulfatase activity
VADAEQDTQTTRLLAALGTAIRVEPALLRAVRLLFPELDVGSEAAAWNHPHVQATPLAFAYDPAQAAPYRQAFADLDAALQRQVAELILAYHTSLSPTIAIEELCMLAARGQTLKPQEGKYFLARLVHSIREQHGDFAEAIRAWIQRVAERQDAEIWQSESLTVLWVAAHLSQMQGQARLAIPEGLQVSRALWLMTPDMPPRHYTIRQRGRLLYMDLEAPPSAVLEAPGSPLSRLTATAPHVQVRYVESAKARQPYVLQPMEQGIALPDIGYVLIRTEHQEIRLESLTLPAWADSMGQDAQGLFLTWAEEQRKAYWVPPGVYPVTDRSGRSLGHVPLQGCWCDAAEAAELLQDGLQQPAWAIGYGRDAYGLYADCRIADVTQRMRCIPPGEFLMGSPVEEAERFDNETQHQVLLTRSFWLAETTCTQALWQAVMGGNPSRFTGAERPVEQVSWDDVQRFLQRVHASAPELALRLPTEAEWEYACRAGTSTPFWFGEQITPEQVNYNGNYPYAGGKKGIVQKRDSPCKSLAMQRLGFVPDAWQCLGVVPGLVCSISGSDCRCSCS